MTIATVRPDATAGLGGATVTGAGGDADLALRDDSDASYLVLDANGDAPGLNFAEPTIPGTAVLKEIRVRVRSALNIPGSITYRVASFDGASATQATTWLNPTTTTVGIFPPDQLNVADVLLGVERVSGAGPELRIYELFIDFIYVEQPEVNVTAPTGTVTDDNTPTVEWGSNLDHDGGEQTRFEVKVFDAAVHAGGGFDPATSPTVQESGEVASAATSYELEEVLPNGDYHAYARVAVTVNGQPHWSEWSP